MKTSDAIFDILKRYTDTVFFVPGGGAAHLVDSLGKSELRRVSALHEQGAAFMVAEQGQACGLAVAHPVHGVVGHLQAGADAVTEERVVFDQQYPQLPGFLVEFGEQGLNLLVAAAVGKFPAGAGGRLEGGFKMRTRLGNPVMIGEILGVKEVGGNAARVDGQGFPEVLVGAAVVSESNRPTRHLA